jgi:hypothetical protein
MSKKDTNSKTHTKFIGVNKHPTIDSYFANIVVKNNSTYLGYFKTDIEAALAYDDYVKLNGLNRRLNFPEPEPENLIPNTRLIRLTQGKFAIVDEEDFERVNQFNWCAAQIRHTWYAIRYDCTGGKRVRIYMHRFIIDTDAEMVDHHNRNGLHNYKSNLRPCNRAQNVVNSKKLKNCSSIYKGVSKNKTCKTFTSCIYKDKKPISLGNYYDEIEAAKAYDTKAKELYGEFARLNFPEINY